MKYEHNEKAEKTFGRVKRQKLGKSINSMLNMLFCLISAFNSRRAMIYVPRWLAMKNKINSKRTKTHNTAPHTCNPLCFHELFAGSFNLDLKIPFRPFFRKDRKRSKGNIRVRTKAPRDSSTFQFTFVTSLVLPFQPNNMVHY